MTADNLERIEAIEADLDDLKHKLDEIIRIVFIEEPETEDDMAAIEEVHQRFAESYRAKREGNA